jgi:NAD(P)-dependent dehydrogenase (short-subunit alcohol dehydrogenase family)
VRAVGRRLDGKVALVTGGGSSPARSDDAIGIGQAISRCFAAEGCRVAVADISSEAAACTLAEIEAAGGEGVALTGDLSSASDCERVVRQAVEALGCLNILVNNLGILPTTRTTEDWDRVMTVNVKSHMLMAQYAVGHFPPSGASIINISSESAVSPPHHPTAPDPVTNPVSLLGAYAASKGAVLALTRELAVRYGRFHVRSNSVSPGGAWTGMAARFWVGQDVPESRLHEMRQLRARSTLLGTEGTAWDIANAALFFASDESRWITGRDLVVDGGARFSKIPVDP